MAAAREPNPPAYTKAAVVGAAQYCLETFRKQGASAKRFSFEEFGMPVYTKDDATNAFMVRVLYRLENRDVEVVPLT